MRRPSLTAMLAGAFTVITLLTFYFVGNYLYNSLYLQLFNFATTDVVVRAKHMRALVSGEESAAILLSHASRFQGQMAGNDAMIVEIRSGDGHLLAEFNPYGRRVVAAPAIPDSQPIRNSDIGQWKLAPGLEMPIVAVQAHFQNGDAATITVARSLEDVLTLLGRYRDIIIRAVVLGALVSTALGAILVRQALRPLHQITREAGRITIEDLNRRLSENKSSPELRDLSVSLNGMLDRLEGGFKLLSNSTENLAHDLRTPVNNLRGQTEVILSRTRTAGEYQSLLASNLEEYQRLTRMIENILFLARAGHAQIPVRRENLLLAEQLRQVAEYFEGLADEGGASIQVRANGTIKADVVMFRRAVSNLLSNALRFTPRGGVIELTAATTNDGVMVCVRNPGPVIAAEHLDKIFERFYRIDEARSNSSDSTGLGLAIVRTIMDLHKGKATVKSENGATRFSLFFPDVAT